jgi:exodeoxyribonuclease III
MRLISWNVNGLRAVMRKGLPEILNQLDGDIVCLQETKIHEDQLTAEMINPDGYPFAYYHFAERKGYSGVATYSKKEPIQVETGLGNEWIDNEGRVLLTRYGEFTLLNIYFPNGQMSDERLKYKMDFYENAIIYFDTLREREEELIICGDYNTAHHPIDLARPKENEQISGFLPIERAWMDKLENHGYLDTFRLLHPDEPDRYSWWSYRTNARPRNIGWRIDYFYITPGLQSRLKDAFILDQVMGSDHCPAGIDIESSE